MPFAEKLRANSVNFLAHLMLAEPSLTSRCGALLGDFCQGIDLLHYPLAVQAAVQRHRMIDRFTDQHAHRRQFLSQFSSARRRFAPVALDVYDDHLLLRHWGRFYQEPCDTALQQRYDELTQLLREPPCPLPAAMQQTIHAMLAYDWFGRYRDHAAVSQALDQIARRIRFANNFSGIMHEIDHMAPALEQSFLQFYPALLAYVSSLGSELLAYQAAPAR